jgi:SAM-dependent methyltransferase
MAKEHFDKSWELQYSKGRMLNRYPHDRVVSLTFKYFGNVKDKSKIKVLDLGCGAGNNSWFFAKEGFDVTGIDASETAIEFARKRFESEKLKGRFLTMGFDEVGALNERFDLILDRGSLCTIEWEDLLGVVDSLKNLMHDDSLFFSFFYNTQHPDKGFCKKTKNGRTFYDLEEGVFGGTGRLTFLDEKSVHELFSGYTIIELYNFKLEPIIQTQGTHGGMAQYVIVAKKGA